MFGVWKFELTDVKLTLVNTAFSRRLFEILTEKKLGKWSKTARNLVYFFEEFEKLCNISNKGHVHRLEDEIQKIETNLCEISRLYF